MESVDIDADEKAGQAVDPSREMQVSDMAALGTNDESVAQNVTSPGPVLSPGVSSPVFCGNRLAPSPLPSQSTLQSRSRIIRKLKSGLFANVAAIE